MKKRARTPASLELPHGDPLPPESPKAARAPDVARQGQRGTYTAVGYRAARIADSEGRSPSRSGSVVHERIDRLKLQYQSREFVRDNGLYRGMLTRARSYIVGPGFKLRVCSSSPKYNRTVEKAFAAWWKQPEITGQKSGPELEGAVMDEALVCGETGVILTDDRAPPRAGLPDRDNLQHVEAEQIMGLDWSAQGIDRDAVGRPLRYWVSPYDVKNGSVLRDKATAYTPDCFLYIASPERPSAKRSVPPCQSAFPNIHRMDDIANSEAIAWQMQSKVALISNRGVGPVVPGAAATTQRGSPSQGDVTQNYLTELPSALIFHGKIGETVTGMERTAPGSSFTESMTMFLRLLGLPLGLPLELILLDWTKSNYSQSRAVLLQAYQSFLGWQTMLVNQFHDRVFHWWLERAIERGEIRARKDQFEHDWILPTFPWLDQLQEAEAQGEKVDRGFTTFTAVAKSLGEDREDLIDDLTLETIEAIEAAQKVEDATGVSVPWEPFAGKHPPSKPAELLSEKDATAGDQGDEAPADAASEPAKKPEKKKAASFVERRAVRKSLVSVLKARSKRRKRVA